MSILFISIGIIVWAALGFISGVYWWTKDLDFTLGDILACIAISVLGPLFFIIGWMYVGDPIIKSNYIIFKRREDK